MKSIIKLTHDEAREYLLSKDAYCNFDLPPYFDFSKLIKEISEKLITTRPEGFILKKKSPSSCEGVNLHLLNNKDGRYAWRRFELMSPVLYTRLVHEMTEKNAWDSITKRFAVFSKNRYIKCVSLPLTSNSQTKREVQVSEWWENVEQESIKKSLHFSHIFHADITDCYGSIYTHSIAWALHTRSIAKTRRGDNLLIGNIIDRRIQEMTNGQTNGIPQGSILMDLIAEMVLGYADMEISEKLKKAKIKTKECTIIRYRDDYRIFTNSSFYGDICLKAIMEVLMDLGLKLNNSKTKMYDDVILGSIKEDKIDYIKSNIPSTNQQKRLLSIRDFSIKHQNSGSLIRLLKAYFTQQDEDDIYTDPEIMVAIATDIAVRNPRTYPIISAILGKIFASSTKTKRKKLIEKAAHKFRLLPNTTYLEIWLQRATIKLNFDIDPLSNICKYAKEMIINKESSVELWNYDWLNKGSAIYKTVERTPIFNKEIYDAMTPIIQPEEVTLFIHES